ncbi:hypothetical protein [Mycolicibacterium lutetiense]
MKVLDDGEPLVPCQCPDCECVNTTDLLFGYDNAPSLSFLAPTPYEALAGIKSLVTDVLRDMAQTGETPPRPSD